MSVTVEEGRIHVDGKPFFPIGLYSVPHASAFPRLRDAGFNVVHSYELERTCYVNLQADRRDFLEREGAGDDAALAYVRQAQEWGLKVMAGFDRTHQLPVSATPLTPEQQESIKRRISLLKEEPGLLAWYLIDEPDGNGIPPAKCGAVRDLVRGADPGRLTATVLCDPARFEGYADTADIINFDYYPIPGPQEAIARLADHVTKLSALTGANRVVVYTAQIFDWNKYDPTRPPCEPTEAQKRCLAYLAILAGAKGVLFFAYDNERQCATPEGALRQWGELAALAGELARLQPVLLKSFSPVTRWPDGAVLLSEAWLEGSCYVFAVHAGDGWVRGRVDAPHAPGTAAEALFEDRNIPLREGGFMDEFGPWAARIYRIRPV